MSRKIHLGYSFYWEKRDEKCTKENENVAEEEDTDIRRNLRRPSMRSYTAYISQSLYPLESTKQEKCIFRKRSKNFQLVYGVLHYKGRGGSFRQVSSS